MARNRRAQNNSVTPSDVFFLFENTSQSEKFDIAKNILDEYVRPKIEKKEFNYSVQNGLDYAIDTDTITDDFISSVQLVDLYPEEDLFGTVRVNIVSSTIDTARLNNIPGQPPFATEPSFETTTWVKCSISANCRISAVGIEPDVAISITQHPIDQPTKQ